MLGMGVIRSCNAVTTAACQEQCTLAEVAAGYAEFVPKSCLAHSTACNVATIDA